MKIFKFVSLSISMDIHVFQFPKIALDELLSQKEPYWKERPLYFIEEKKTSRGTYPEHPEGRWDINIYYEILTLPSGAKLYSDSISVKITQFLLTREVERPLHGGVKEYLYFVLSNVKPEIKKGDIIHDAIANQNERRLGSVYQSVSQIKYLNKIFLEETPFRPPGY